MYFDNNRAEPDEKGVSFLYTSTTANYDKRKMVHKFIAYKSTFLGQDFSYNRLDDKDT
jgi:hypothetical protein